MRSAGEFAPVSQSPLLDRRALPHLAHVEHDLGLGEVGSRDQLLDTLAAEAAEHAADLSRPHEVMHGSNHSQDSTRHLTSGQDERHTSHMTSEHRTESPELNRRINTLIMRGLDATEAEAQARREFADTATDEPSVLDEYTFRSDFPVLSAEMRARRRG